MRLCGDERHAVGRQIRIAKPRVRRQLDDVAAAAGQPVEIAVQPDVAPRLGLIEVDGVAADRGRRAKVPGRELPWRGSVERDAVERWKAGGGRGAGKEPRRARRADEAIEPRTAR